ncbi:2Fe-2S iron-sulfur cluster binding domain protein [Burkholderia cenocepacia]|uniref:2Fe-2S iron-sulfur cluster binding domain protein n=1 Tax=Burkholderia cenocepacia TaxID=95486 RepID=A0AAN0VNC8_9BURK|nr:2Fe-2S iron-sulfur cluster binding domain protein [Burkholderia cenocepacia]
MVKTFHVTLHPSGHEFDVIRGKTVLTAALEAGYHIAYSCRSGTCGTCRARLIEGNVEYNLSQAITTVEAGTALLCLAEPASDLVLEVEELALHLQPARQMPCRVKKVEKAAPDVAIVTLRTHYNDNLLYAAGQYIDFLLPDGKRRSYSIATAPALEGPMMDIDLHIRHLPGGLFTERVFGSLKAGEILRFEGPLGTFYLREESARPIIFLASGTGFAPIKAIVEYALRRNIERPMRLYWGGRLRRDIYGFELAESWAGSHEHFDFVPVLSDPLPEDEWHGRSGLVHRAVMEDYPDLSGFDVYACGNPAMVDAARTDFVRRGLPSEHFYADSFITEAERSRSALEATPSTEAQ